MTDERTEQVKHEVTAAAEDARDSRAHLRLRVAAAVALFGIIALALTFWLSASTLQREVGDLQQSRAQAAHDAQTLAEQVRSLGAVPAVQPPATVTPGPAGAPGAAGRGVLGTQVTGGHLAITYTDGTTVDLGQVAGQPGVTGRGVTGTTIHGTDLVVTYSDGTNADVGSVVGPAGATGSVGTPGAPGVAGTPGAAGVGVASVTINSAGRLVVTYTNGTSSEAGSVLGPAGPTGPAGPRGDTGATGPQGAPPSSWSWRDALGRTQTCTRSGGSDASPTYSCTASSPLSGG